MQLTKEKKESFARAVIEKLRELVQSPSQHHTSMTSDLPDREKLHTPKLVQAFCRLMVEFDMQIDQEAEFLSYFATLCSLITLDSDENSAS